MLSYLFGIFIFLYNKNTYKGISSPVAPTNYSWLMADSHYLAPLVLTIPQYDNTSIQLQTVLYEEGDIGSFILFKGVYFFPQEP